LQALEDQTKEEIITYDTQS